MSNDSSTGGFIQPSDSGAVYDDELDDTLQTMLVGVTGLPGNMVRPRWQPGNPKQPAPDEDWCAFGVPETTPDAGPAIIHDPSGDGRDVEQRHEEFDILCSFYGPHGGAYAAKARDGAGMPQNNAALREYGMAFVGVGAVRAVPDLVNQVWRKRQDLTITLRRLTQREYATLNFESAEVTITTDTGPSGSVVTG